MSFVVIFLLFSISFICSSSSIWTFWIGLEMFNFFLIPWLSEGVSQMKSVKVFFYFTIQTLASGFFVLGGVNCSISTLFYSLAIIGLVIKLGMFPSHLWVLYVVENMAWKKFSFFMTLGKLGSLFVMSYLQPMIYFSYPLLSGVLVPMTSLNSHSLRKMLSLSSISHMSWLMMCLMLSKPLMVVYVSIYWLIFISSCIYIFNTPSAVTLKDLKVFKRVGLLEVFVLLNLMGFPPFLGFFPKVFTLKAMVNEGLFVEAVLMSISALLPFFFYLKMILLYTTLVNKLNVSFSIPNYMTYSLEKTFIIVISILFIGLETWVVMCMSFINPSLGILFKSKLDKLKDF
nr:NADH dehydrogenase subunit 2 [Colpocephalum spinicollis]